MTRVRFNKNRGKIVSVECSGHTEYAEQGEDILCAALSSIVQTAVLGIMQVAGIAADFERDDKKGFLKLTLPVKLTERQRHDADVIMETLLAGVSDLYTGYSDFIELEVD